ncbi:isochorismatase family protein [Brachybacterium fresconis]|uniref:Nicotinamidase-related amidase n=1 Tax=Brachybacterium fresconis TaxID=173363 RepID=A0ABS4YL87_9MICO|nr:isochorismatase family protein [Brachybacterium fresconis]MBP2409556.1 nicotinamidase-related amidase [Brachybacterium fresconis]
MTAPRRALILIDVQLTYFDGPLEIQYPTHSDSLPEILRAIDAANAAGIPVVAVQHTMGEGAPVFDATTAAFALHPEIEAHRKGAWKSVVKEYSSVYAHTDVATWLREQDVDTVTLVGHMTNNCILASAVEGEGLGFTTEVLRDATGAIHLANEAGSVTAETVHTTLMTLLNSNFAAVGSTAAWLEALSSGEALSGSDLVSSAIQGAQEAQTA